MNFCKLDDVKAVLPAGSRFDGTYADILGAVTDDFNRYMRRNLDAAVGLVELFDMITLSSGMPYRLYTEKKNITVTKLMISRTREWTDDNNIIDPAYYEVDGPVGKITLYGPFDFCPNAIRVEYNGGYDAVAGDATTMAVPAALKSAAVEECVYRINQLINQKAGQSQEVDRNQRVDKIKLIDGLLPTTARTLSPYRRMFSRVV